MTDKINIIVERDKEVVVIAPCLAAKKMNFPWMPAISAWH